MMMVEFSSNTGAHCCMYEPKQYSKELWSKFGGNEGEEEGKSGENDLVCTNTKAGNMDEEGDEVSTNSKQWGMHCRRWEMEREDSSVEKEKQHFAGYS
eukprot:13832676-Ditylum_brightwellii.AAC.1